MIYIISYIVINQTQKVEFEDKIGIVLIITKYDHPLRLLSLQAFGSPYL